MLMDYMKANVWVRLTLACDSKVGSKICLNIHVVEPRWLGDRDQLDCGNGAIWLKKFNDWFVEIESRHLAIEYLLRDQSIPDGPSKVVNRRKSRSDRMLIRVVVVIRVVVNLSDYARNVCD
jgi:hypothetical protein